MRTRLLQVLLTVVAAFVGGLLSPRLFEHVARAEQSAASTVYVPADGLTFRTFDGRVVARLSYDAHGGIFDVYREVGGPSAQRESVVPPSTTRAPRIAFSHKEPVDLGF